MTRRLLTGLAGAVAAVAITELFTASFAAGWIAWIIVMLASFGILEWRGLTRKATAGTLSYQVWQVLFTDAEVILDGKHPRQPRILVYFVALSPLVWLILHFALGGRLG